MLAPYQGIPGGMSYHCCRWGVVPCWRGGGVPVGTLLAWREVSRWSAVPWRGGEVSRWGGTIVGAAAGSRCRTIVGAAGGVSCHRWRGGGVPGGMSYRCWPGGECPGGAPYRCWRGGSGWGYRCCIVPLFVPVVVPLLARRRIRTVVGLSRWGAVPLLARRRSVGGAPYRCWRAKCPGGMSYHCWRGRWDVVPLFGRWGGPSLRRRRSSWRGGRVSRWGAVPLLARRQRSRWGAVPLFGGVLSHCWRGGDNRWGLGRVQGVCTPGMFATSSAGCGAFGSGSLFVTTRVFICLIRIGCCLCLVFVARYGSYYSLW